MTNQEYNIYQGVSFQFKNKNDVTQIMVSKQER